MLGCKVLQEGYGNKKIKFACNLIAPFCIKSIDFSVLEACNGQRHTLTEPHQERRKIGF
jgi:hypothetical protein